MTKQYNSRLKIVCTAFIYKVRKISKLNEAKPPLSCLTIIKFYLLEKLCFFKSFNNDIVMAWQVLNIQRIRKALWTTNKKSSSGDYYLQLTSLLFKQIKENFPVLCVPHHFTLNSEYWKLFFFFLLSNLWPKSNTGTQFPRYAWFAFKK